jgi:hypothetical protein
LNYRTLNLHPLNLPTLNAPLSPTTHQVKMLTERINELVDQAESLGCEGKVEEAQGITRLCEQLKEERQQLANQGSRIPSMIDTAMRRVAG